MVLPLGVAFLNVSLDMADTKKKKKRERKGYFYEKEEQAVVDYINSTSEEEKTKIYNEILKPAFTKMIESIIRRYNLYIPDEEFDETFNDTMSFLMMKLSYYDPKKNFKAYSYCGTICKNYLIYKITQFTKRQNRHVSYDNPLETIKEAIGDDIKYSYTDDEEPYGLFKSLTSRTVANISKLLESGMANEERKLTDNEIKVGRALIELFSNWEDLFLEMGSNKFNKSSFILYVKDLTLLSTQEISKAMKLFKVGYFALKKDLLDNE